MELFSVIRRRHYRDHFSIREISRRTGVSTNSRKYLRSDAIDRSSTSLTVGANWILTPTGYRRCWAGGREVPQAEADDQAIARDLVALGYDGSYNRVAAFAATGRLLAFSPSPRS